MNKIVFSHPDYTVGFGITPNQPPKRVADYTAGRESHPAPKNLFICFSRLKLSQITMDVNCKRCSFLLLFSRFC